MEFFAFPYGNKAIVKRMDISEEPSTPEEEPFINEKWGSTDPAPSLTNGSSRTALKPERKSYF